MKHGITSKLAVKEDDRFSLVIYETNVHVKFELHYMTQRNKEKASRAIERLTTHVGTNLCGGLCKGRCNF